MAKSLTSINAFVAKLLSRIIRSSEHKHTLKEWPNHPEKEYCTGCSFWQYKKEIG